MTSTREKIALSSINFGGAIVFSFLTTFSSFTIDRDENLNHIKAFDNAVRSATNSQEILSAMENRLETIDSPLNIACGTDIPVRHLRWYFGNTDEASITNCVEAIHETVWKDSESSFSNISRLTYIATVAALFASLYNLGSAVYLSRKQPSPKAEI